VNDRDTAPELTSRLGDQLPPVPGTSPTAPPRTHDAGQVDDNADMRDVAGTPLPCLLCGGPEAVRAFFVPKDQKRVRAPSGRSRAFRYSLCAACAADPNAPRVAEQRMLAAVDALARRN
jgi:hypothetical protein